MMQGNEPAYVDMSSFGNRLGSLSLSMLHKKPVAEDQYLVNDEMVQLSSELTHRRRHRHHKREPRLKYNALVFTDDDDGSDITVYQV